MLTRIKIFPVSNYKQDDIYRNINSSAFLQKNSRTSSSFSMTFHDFSRLSMTLAVFHDFPGLENGLTKFHDFPWLSRKSGHPAKHRCRMNQSQMTTLPCTTDCSPDTLVLRSMMPPCSSVTARSSGLTVTQCNYTCRQFYLSRSRSNTPTFVQLVELKCIIT